MMNTKDVRTENRMGSRNIPEESDSDLEKKDSEELKKLGRQTED